MPLPSRQGIDAIFLKIFYRLHDRPQSAPAPAMICPACQHATPKRFSQTTACALDNSSRAWHDYLMTTTPPTPSRDDLEAELIEICEDFDGASIIGMLLLVGDFFDDTLSILRGERTQEQRLLLDMIDISQSAPLEDVLPKIIRALEIDEEMSNLE